MPESVAPPRSKWLKGASPDQPTHKVARNFLERRLLSVAYWVARSSEEGDDTVDRDLEEHLVLSDPFVKDFCIDCTYPQNEEGKITWPSTTINYDLFQLNPTKPNSYHNE